MIRMQKGTKLLLITALVLAMFVCYTIILNRCGREEEPAEVGPQYQMVTNFTAADITGLAWGRGDDLLSLSSDGQRWSMDNIADFPLNQATIQDLVQAISRLSSPEQFVDPADVAAFGLEAPLTLLITAGGEEHRFYLGRQLDGAWFISQEPDLSYLYQINGQRPAALDYDWLDLAVSESLPKIETAQVVSVTVGENSYAYVSDADDPSKWTRSGRDANAALIQSLLDQVNALAWLQVWDYAPSDQTLLEYGLLPPVYHLSVTYTDLRLEDSGEKDADGQPVYVERPVRAVLDLDVGKTDDQGRCYARLVNSSLIYLIQPDLLNAMVELIG